MVIYTISRLGLLTDLALFSHFPTFPLSSPHDSLHDALQMIEVMQAFKPRQRETKGVTSLHTRFLLVY